MATDTQTAQVQTSVPSGQPSTHPAQRWPAAETSNGVLGSVLGSPDGKDVLQLPLQPRQLRSLRCMNYRPVALRRTEHRARTSFPSGSNGSADATSAPLRAEKGSEDEFAVDGDVHSVTGPPTKDHWKTDTPFTVPLDQHARFHPSGMRSRACDACWTKYKTWEMDRCARSNSGDGTGGPLTPTMSISSRDERQLAENVAGSVPRNWEWSTF
ncbi:MAG: hypothetical protein M1838_004309 [Thelocarpon superellum]|nr:MAG: hypothetical protein M1838_004309 [Thelocarpon superellum]